MPTAPNMIEPPDAAGPLDAAAVIARVTRFPAWALIRRATRAGARATIGAVGGRPWEAASLLDIPLESGAPPVGRSVDRLVAVPFRQIAERGFPAHDDGAPLVVVDIDYEAELAVADVIAALPDVPLIFDDDGGFTTSDADYEQLVADIIANEIGQGEGANLVIGRQFRAVIGNWSVDAALSVYRRLLEREHGAYWTYLFYTGERFLIGASPERHVSISDGSVLMNPISGTFRLPRLSDDELVGNSEQFVAAVKPDLMEFLRDQKEIYELFMVVDEELKMMCDICSGGGQVVGPFLKPMSHLIHTEYLLAGHTDRDPREVLRDTMFAATVTGSPVGNAARLIAKYEPAGRGYYGAALALFGRDSAGGATLDSPIVIRTADIDDDGALSVTAGATLVRDSNPAGEVAETRAKAAGILGAFGLGNPPPPRPAAALRELVLNEDVLLELNRRNSRLAPFWLSDQGGVAAPDSLLAGKTAVILDGDDDFAKMIRHLLGALGLDVTIVPFREYRPGCLGGYDLVVLGPGPGDPRDLSDAKIANLSAALAGLLADPEARFLAVCLGHQALCLQLGLPLEYKDIVFQGVQAPVDLTYGKPDAPGYVDRVGFYNTFVAKAPPGISIARGAGGDDISFDADAATRGDICFDADAATGDINAVYGPGFAGVQFHAESILTQHGIEIMRKLLHWIFNEKAPADG